MIRFIDQDQIRHKTEKFLDSTMGTPAGDLMLILEVGQSEDYDDCHIRRAIHFTPEELDQAGRDGRFSKASEIVLYGEDEETVLEAAHGLIELGYANLYYFPDGKQRWFHDDLWRQTSLVPTDGFELLEMTEAEFRQAA